MRIIVPMKMVPDLVEDLELNDDGTGLDPDETEIKLNEFDDHALEEAICLKEAGGGSVTVIALDGEGVDKILYTALAKGADKVIKLTGPEPEEMDGNYGLAKLFAGAIADIPHDLVLTGVQGCDDRDGQIGPMVAAMLNEPTMSVVSALQVAGNTITLSKEYAGGVMGSFEIDTPAVLGIQAARQTPRYVPVSKVRQIQQSAKIDEIDVDDAADALSKVSAMAPPETGAGAEMLSGVDALVDILKQKGVLS